MPTTETNFKNVIVKLPAKKLSLHLSHDEFVALMNAASGRILHGEDLQAATRVKIKLIEAQRRLLSAWLEVTESELQTAQTDEQSPEILKATFDDLFRHQRSINIQELLGFGELGELGDAPSGVHKS